MCARRAAQGAGFWVAALVVLLSLLGPGQASAAVAELFLDGEDAPIARRGFELIAPAP